MIAAWDEGAEAQAPPATGVALLVVEPSPWRTRRAIVHSRNDSDARTHSQLRFSHPTGTKTMMTAAAPGLILGHAAPLLTDRRGVDTMGMAAPTYWTAEMVRQLPDDGNRYEVVHGELLVTPAPRFDHQRW